ncbi:MAG TPA: HPr family phosphocarrier protein [Rhizomicrobium sp.]|nr:HPr family phosphocarrier protein [Rhizomicrobium sp.]
MKITVTIPNKKGLHARASAKVVEAAARFKSHITISKAGQSVDARSVMGLMMLGAPQGTEVDIEAEGPDAEEALAALKALVEVKFGED